MSRLPGDRVVPATGGAGTRRAAVGLLVAQVGRLRITPVYAGLVLLMWTVVLLVSPTVGAQIVHVNSTNVANLVDGRVYTLFSSAFVLGDRPEILGVLAMVVVLGIAELSWGWVRTAGVFLFGHIVATLLVFAGLATGIALHRLGGDLATAADVGISYGTVAVLGGLLVSAPLRHGRRWQVLATVIGLLGVAVLRDFTSVGHLTSLLLGFAAGYLLRRRARRTLVTTKGGHRELSGTAGVLPGQAGGLGRRAVGGRHGGEGRDEDLRVSRL